MSDESDVPDEDDFVALTKDLVRKKIEFVLTHYSRLSPSMLQVGIGTGISPTFWRAVLGEMIKEGTVQQEVFTAKFPNGRDQTLKILSLVQKDASANTPDVRGPAQV
jgi:hypothetical protein